MPLPPVVIGVGVLGSVAMTGERQAIEVHAATEVNDSLVAAMARLIPQLSNSSPPPDVDALEAIVSSNASVLLLAVDPVATGEEAILGSMTLVVFRIPTGLRAWIEDVVVDEAARGRGVGETLNRAAIEWARVEGATTVDLTSRPSREAANRLYQRLGCQERSTNVYRLGL